MILLWLQPKAARKFNVFSNSVDRKLLQSNASLNDFAPSQAPFVMHHFFLHERGEEAGEPGHSSLSAQTKYTRGTWLQEALAKHKNASDNSYLALYIQHTYL